MLSRLCQQFPGISPCRVLWELEQDPDQWMLRIVEVRNYEAARDAVARAKDEAELTKTDLVNVAIEHRLRRKHAVFLQRLGRTANGDGAFGGASSR